MIENYYTPEQLDVLKQRREQLGEERINQSHTDWAELIAAVRAEKERGTDPRRPEGRGAGQALDGPRERVYRR